MGDGYTTPIHCERVSVLDHHVEPDSGVILCGHEPQEDPQVVRFSGDPVRRDLTTGKWFFWDETWTLPSRLYATELECRAALDDYCRIELGLPSDFLTEERIREGWHHCPAFDGLLTQGENPTGTHCLCGHPNHA